MHEACIRGMSPTRLRDQLAATGVKLQVRNGVLFASLRTPEQRELIAANKRGLIAVLTYQCPECNQPLRLRADTHGITWLECEKDRVHFGERLGELETIPCAGDECTEQIQLTNGQGWCSTHRMMVRIRQA